jgi:hypothetical protein
MNRCKNCANFTHYSDSWDVEYRGAHAGVCRSDKFLYSDSPQVARDGLRYWDFEGYSAGFEVGEAFGCIHWVAK